MLRHLQACTHIQTAYAAIDGASGFMDRPRRRFIKRAQGSRLPMNAIYALQQSTIGRCCSPSSFDMPANRALKTPLSFNPRTWWQRLSARVRWFGALVVVVVALAVVFSEGLMTNAMLGGDAWATRMVDDIVQGQTGVRRFYFYTEDLYLRRYRSSCSGMCITSTYRLARSTSPGSYWAVGI